MTHIPQSGITAGKLKKPLQMENYLPPEIPAVAGDPLELFWDSIFGAKNITNYRLVVRWDAWQGITVSNRHKGYLEYNPSVAGT